MDKRGQFYLIAAILIVLAITSITSVTTYALVKSKPRTFESMGMELKEESSRIIDFGIYNQTNLNSVLNDFSDNEFAPYFLGKTNNANIVLIYGNKTDLFATQYTAMSTGTIYATIGGGTTSWEIVNSVVNRTKITTDPETDNIDVEILNNSYSFELRGNEMFYFVMLQKKGEEIYVEKN